MSQFETGMNNLRQRRNLWLTVTLGSLATELAAASESWSSNSGSVIIGATIVGLAGAAFTLRHALPNTMEAQSALERMREDQLYSSLLSQFGNPGTN